jgi:hypothetical protein
MKIKNRKRSPLISERLEIQSDPFLRESPEVKSRLVSQLSATMLKEKLHQLKQQYPDASRQEMYRRLADFLNQVSKRERSRRFHG